MVRLQRMAPRTAELTVHIMRHHLSDSDIDCGVVVVMTVTAVRVVAELVRMVVQQMVVAAVGGGGS